MNRSPPKIENAPGLAWRPRKHGWEARWRARGDLVRRGFRPINHRLWVSTEQDPLPSAASMLYIADQCNKLQAEMLVWANGGITQAATFDHTLRSLIGCYQTDGDSTYKKLRFVTRDNYDGLCRRLDLAHGDVRIAEINARLVLRWHETWSNSGTKMSMAHSLVGMLRTLVNFGATILEDKECERLALVLHRRKFEQGKPRSKALNTAHAVAVCAMAHAMGYPSIAMAQSFQTDGILRQKDVIGELVPISEPGLSDVIIGNSKWLRGIRYEEIDADLTLHHVTSKRGKPLDLPLRDAPLVMAEFRKMLDLAPDAVITRDMLPATGPIIINDNTGVPWSTMNFRRQWRKIATAAGVPKDVFNMDSRAGAISEATDAGIDLHKVQHAATHGDISMTQRYSRNSAEKTAEVLRGRVDFRNKTGKSEA